MSPQTIGILCILTSACLLAVSQTIAKAVISRLPLFVLLLSRSVGALVLLIPMTLILGWDASPSVIFLILITLGGIIWPGVVNVFAYKALKVLPVNVNRPVFQTYPAVAFVLSIPLGLGTFSWAKLAGVALATAGGGGFALFNKDAHGTGKRLARSALGLVAISAVLQALGTLVWKYAAHKIPPYQMNMLQHLAAVAFFGFFARMEMSGKDTERRTFSWKDVLLVGFSGMLLFGIGNTLLFTSLRYLDPGPAGAIYSVNILLTAIVARVALKERWTMAQALSALMVLAGVAVLSVCR